MTCNGFSCEGQPMQNNPLAECGNNPCTIEDCCVVSRTPSEGVTTCLDFDCSQRPGFETNQTVECSSEPCTVDECCTIETEIFTCFGFECPGDMITDSSQNCSTNPCIIDECCTQPQTEEVISIIETNENRETTERQNNGDGTTTVIVTNSEGVETTNVRDILPGEFTPPAQPSAQPTPQPGQTPVQPGQTPAQPTPQPGQAVSELTQEQQDILESQQQQNNYCGNFNCPDDFTHIEQATTTLGNDQETCCKAIIYGNVTASLVLLDESISDHETFRIVINTEDSDLETIHSILGTVEEPLICPQAYHNNDANAGINHVGATEQNIIGDRKYDSYLTIGIQNVNSNFTIFGDFTNWTESSNLEITDGLIRLNNELSMQNNNNIVIAQLTLPITRTEFTFSAKLQGAHSSGETWNSYVSIIIPDDTSNLEPFTFIRNLSIVEPMNTNNHNRSITGNLPVFGTCANFNNCTSVNATLTDSPESVNCPETGCTTELCCTNPLTCNDVAFNCSDSIFNLSPDTECSLDGCNVDTCCTLPTCATMPSDTCQNNNKLFYPDPRQITCPDGNCTIESCCIETCFDFDCSSDERKYSLDLNSSQIICDPISGCNNETCCTVPTTCATFSQNGCSNNSIYNRTLNENVDTCSNAIFDESLNIFRCPDDELGNSSECCNIEREPALCIEQGDDFCPQDVNGYTGSIKQEPGLSCENSVCTTNDYERCCEVIDIMTCNLSLCSDNENYSNNLLESPLPCNSSGCTTENCCQPMPQSTCANFDCSSVLTNVLSDYYTGNTLVDNTCDGVNPSSCNIETCCELILVSQQEECFGPCQSDCTREIISDNSICQEINSLTCSNGIDSCQYTCNTDNLPSNGAYIKNAENQVVCNEANGYTGTANINCSYENRDNPTQTNYSGCEPFTCNGDNNNGYYFRLNEELNRIECANCPPGTYNDEELLSNMAGGTSCQPKMCNINQYVDIYYNCVDCPVGMISNRLSEQSVELIIGEQNEGMGLEQSCNMCEVNRYYDVSQSQCVQCPEGSSNESGPADITNNSCNNCNAGYYYDSVLSECTICPVNKTSLPGLANSENTVDNCNYCLENHYYDTTIDECVICSDISTNPSRPADSTNTTCSQECTPSVDNCLSYQNECYDIDGFRDKIKCNEAEPGYYLDNNFIPKICKEQLSHCNTYSDTECIHDQQRGISYKKCLYVDENSTPPGFSIDSVGIVRKCNSHPMCNINSNECVSSDAYFNESNRTEFVLKCLELVPDAPDGYILDESTGIIDSSAVSEDIINENKIQTFENNMCENKDDALKNLMGVSLDNQYVNCDLYVNDNMCHHTIYDLVDYHSNLTIDEASELPYFHKLLRDVCPNSCQTTLRNNNMSVNEIEDGTYSIYDCHTSGFECIGEFHKCVFDETENLCKKKYMVTREGNNCLYDNNTELICEYGEDDCFDKNYCDDSSLWESICNNNCEYNSNFEITNEGICYSSTGQDCSGHTSEEQCNVGDCKWYDKTKCPPFHFTDICYPGKDECISHFDYLDEKITCNGQLSSSLANDLLKNTLINNSDSHEYAELCNLNSINTSGGGNSTLSLETRNKLFESYGGQGGLSSFSNEDINMLTNIILFDGLELMIHKLYKLNNNDPGRRINYNLDLVDYIDNQIDLKNMSISSSYVERDELDMYYARQNNINYTSEFNESTTCYEHNLLLDQYILCENIQVQPDTTLPTCSEQNELNSEMYNNNYNFLIESCSNEEFYNNCNKVCQTFNNVRTYQQLPQSNVEYPVNTELQIHGYFSDVMKKISNNFMARIGYSSILRTSDHINISSSYYNESWRLWGVSKNDFFLKTHLWNPQSTDIESKTLKNFADNSIFMNMRYFYDLLPDYVDITLEGLYSLGNTITPTIYNISLGNMTPEEYFEATKIGLVIPTFDSDVNIFGGIKPVNSELFQEKFDQIKQFLLDIRLLEGNSCEAVLNDFADNQDDVNRLGGTYSIKSIINNPHNVPEFGNLIENNLCHRSADCSIGLYCNSESLCRPCYEDFKNSENIYSDPKCNGGWTTIPECISNSNNIEIPELCQITGVIPSSDSPSACNVNSVNAKNLVRYMGVTVPDYVHCEHNNCTEEQNNLNLEILQLINSDECRHLPYHILDDIKNNRSHHTIDNEYIEEYRNMCDYYKNLHLQHYREQYNSAYSRCSISDDCQENMKCFNNHCIPNPCEQSGFRNPPLYDNVDLSSKCDNDTYIEDQNIDGTPYSVCPELNTTDEGINAEINGYYFQYNNQKTTLGLGQTSCKNNYNGTPVINCNDGVWDIQGCNENNCTIPTNYTGYNIENIDGSTVSELGNINCQEHYNGIASVNCYNDGGVFVFSGCYI